MEVITVTAEQASNKWNSMKREYMSCKDNNKRTSPKRCRFYDEFEELLGCRPSMSSLSTESEAEPEDSCKPTKKRNARSESKETWNL